MSKAVSRFKISMDRPVVYEVLSGRRALTWRVLKVVSAS